MNRLNKHFFNALFVFLLLGISLLAGSCNSWMSDDDFMSKIESEVHDANAAPISVYVRYANSKMGTTEPSGLTTMKVDVATEISAVTSDDYGFVRWAAFSTNDFPTSKQHSTLIYENAEDYEEKFLGLELPASEVVFSNPTEPTTNVKIYKERNDVFIIPIVTRRPYVTNSVPSNGRSDVVRNTQIRILFSKPIDEASLKDEFGNSNIQVTSGSAVMTESSEDLSAKDITDYFQITLGASKKMLTFTLKKDSEDKPIYLDGNSSITINIFEDVCDTDGYNMNGRHTIQFNTGTKLDSLAPEIKILRAGINQDCQTFEQYDFDNKQSTLNEHNIYNHTEAAEATEKLLAKYTTNDNKYILKQRVKDYINIWVQAVDISGSGSGIVKDRDTTSESDVAQIQIKASLYLDNDGHAAEDKLEVKQYNYALGNKDSNCQIDAVFENATGGYTDPQNPNKFVKNTQGTLFTYDLSDLPDGLIKIDLWAVDMVGNSGDKEAPDYIDEYNNGYRSIFVVKDSTPPDANANKNYVSPTGAATDDGYYNRSTYSSIKIPKDISSIAEEGNSNLISLHDDIKWIVKPTADTNWVEKISPNDSAWKPITSDYDGFPIPNTDGPVTLTYALMDDLGNISKTAVKIADIKFDGTAPSFKDKKISWKVDEGSTEGIASKNILDTQTLVIPLKEITAGLKIIKLSVKNDNPGSTEFNKPFDASNLSVTIGDSATPLTKGTDYEISNNTLTFKTLQTNFDTDLKIKNIKIAADSTTAQQLEGSYSVIVTATDAANNSTETNANQKESLSIDTTVPQINNISIHNIRKTKLASSSSTYEYWIKKDGLTDLDSTPKTDVYITFTENNSGPKVFDFTGSTITLNAATNANSNDGSKLYDMIGNVIKSTVSGNKLIVDTAVEARKIRGDSVTVKISNVSISTTSSVALKLSDVATNTPTASVTDKLTSNNITGYIGSFKYDSDAPVISITKTYDRGTAAGTDTGVAKALDNYTNEEYIDAKLTLNSDNTKVTGIYKLVLSDDAEFVPATAGYNITTLKVGNTNTNFVLSNDNKTLTFGNANDYLIVDSFDKTIEIKNIKLTGGQKENKVTIKPISFSEFEGSTQTSTITLDTTAPQWKDAGLYTAMYPYKDEQGNNKNHITAAEVYPHPDDHLGLTYKVNNVIQQHNGMNILKFYKKESETNIRIDPYLVEDNYQKAHWASTEANSNFSYNDDEFFFTTAAGQYSVYVYDKAGNRSQDMKFKIYDSPSMDSGIDALEYNAQIIAPDGYTKAKNSYPSSQRIKGGKRSTSYDFWPSGGTDSIKVVPYVLKKPDGTSSWQLKLKVSDFKEGTTSYAPIEKYAITTRYTKFPSDGDGHDTDYFNPAIPEDWRDYPGTTTLQNELSEIKSIVDSNGDIILTLPNHDCPPITLWLVDGVGNSKGIILNPGLSSGHHVYEANGWKIDNEVGLSGYSIANSSNTVTPNLITELTDVSLYKDNYKVTISGLRDNVLFTTSSDANEDHYTFKSRIIVKTSSGSPNYEDFYSTSLKTTPAGEANASEWSYVKQTSDTTSVSFELNLPQYTSTSSYNLWYIVEDTVGNKEIAQLNQPGASVSKWLYDVTAPVAGVLTINDNNKVNNIDHKNYYSSSSFVNYSITETGSGVKNAGPGHTSTCTTLAAAQAQTFNAVRFDLTAAPVNGKITISGITDFAGNGGTNGVELAYHGDSTWVMQSEPELATNYESDMQNPGHDDWGDMGFKVTLANDNRTYSVQASAWSKKVTIKLRAMWHENGSTSWTTSSSTNKLLGWLITDTDPNHTTFKDFYTQADVGQGKSLESLTDDTYEFTKNDDSTPWKDVVGALVNGKRNGTKYFYPVNRAGLVCKTPVVVIFEENTKPDIVDNSTSYENIGTYENGSEKTNYLKANSEFKFTSNVSLLKCEILVQQKNQNDDNYSTKRKIVYKDNPASNEYLEQNTNIPIKEVQISNSGLNYTLDLSALGTDLDNYKLSLLLYSPTEWESTGRDLLGNVDNNNWTYDVTKPTLNTIDVSNAAQITGDTDTTYYLKNKTDSNAVITLVANDNRAGIKEYQRSSSSTFATIDETVTNGQFTLAATTTKTTYYFRAIDKAGNISSNFMSIVLQKDTDAPTGIVSKSYTGTTTGHIDDTTTENTVYYNYDNVTKVSLSIPDRSDNSGGAGIGGQYLYYKLGDGEETAAPSNVVSIDFAANTTKTVTLIIKDKLGNAREYGPYTFNGKKPTGSIAYSTVVDGTVKTPNTPDEQTDTIAFRSAGAGAISEITLTATNVKDSRGNAAIIYYTVDSDTTQNVITDTLKLPCPTNSTKTATYNVYAKDSLGNTVLLRKFKLSGAAPSGTVSYTATTGDGTMKDSNSTETAITIYYNASTVTQIMLSSTVKDAGNNTDILYSQIGDGALVKLTESNTGGSKKYALPCPSNKNQAYKIIAKDSIGNTVEIATITLKGTAPTGSVTGYTLKKSSGNATEATASAAGDYIVTAASGDTPETVTYNPNTVTKIEFDYDTITDCGAGHEIVAKIDGTDYKTNLNSSSDIPLDATWTGTKVITIVVRDKVGNESAVLKKIAFKTTKPAPATSTTIKYNEVDRNHINNNSYTTTFTPTVADAGNGAKCVYMPKAADFTISLNTATVFFGKMDYVVVYSGTVPGTTAPSTDWTTGNVSDGKLVVPVDGTKLTSTNNYVFVYFRDMLGNTSDYGIAYNSNSSNVGWWRVDSTGPTITINKLIFREASGTDALTEATGNIQGAWKKTTEGGIDTLIYNPSIAKKLRIKELNCSDNVAGVEDKNYLFYRVKDSNDAGTKITLSSDSEGGTLDLSGLTVGTVYEIFAKDKFGNETIYKRLTANTTAPTISSCTYAFSKNGSAADTTYYSIASTPDADGYINIQYVPDQLNNTQGGQFTVTTVAGEKIKIMKSVNGGDKTDFISNNNPFDTTISGEISLALSAGSSATIELIAYNDIQNSVTVKKFKFHAKAEITEPYTNRIGGIPFIPGDSSDVLSLGGTSNSASAMQSRIAELPQSIKNVADNTITQKIASAAKKASKKSAKKTTSKKSAIEAPAVQQVEQLVEQVAPAVTEVVAAQLPQAADAEPAAVTTEAVVQTPVAEVSVVQPVAALETAAPIAEVSPATHSKLALWIVLCAFIAAVGGVVVMLRKRKNA